MPWDRRSTHEPRGDDSPPRLLILDDEEAILLPISEYFRQRRYHVAATREPEEAEALLDHDPFDLVILDLALTCFWAGPEVLSDPRAGPGSRSSSSGYISDEVENEPAC